MEIFSTDRLAAGKCCSVGDKRYACAFNGIINILQGKVWIIILDHTMSCFLLE